MIEVKLAETDGVEWAIDLAVCKAHLAEFDLFRWKIEGTGVNQQMR